MKYINEVIEFERAMNGQEDDLDDEAWMMEMMNSQCLII